jgi:hypothetical protein
MGYKNVGFYAISKKCSWRKFKALKGQRKYKLADGSWNQRWIYVGYQESTRSDRTKLFNKVINEFSQFQEALNSDFFADDASVEINKFARKINTSFDLTGNIFSQRRLQSKTILWGCIVIFENPSRSRIKTDEEIKKNEITPTWKNVVTFENPSRSRIKTSADEEKKNECHPLDRKHFYFLVITQPLRCRPRRVLGEDNDRDWNCLIERVKHNLKEFTVFNAMQRCKF